MLAHSLRVEAGEIDYGEFLRSALEIKSAGIAYLALQQFQISRVYGKFQTG